MNEIDPRAVLGRMLGSSAKAVWTHDWANVETLSGGLLVRTQIAMYDQGRHRRAVTATCDGVGLCPFVRVIHNEATSEPPMVLQRKPVEECDQGIVQFTFLAPRRFSFLLGLVGDNGGASLSSGAN